ncbi:hypothetical protein J7643_15785 [bacterium]|nr:hypothetical protein [bacterium]
MIQWFLSLGVAGALAYRWSGALRAPFVTKLISLAFLWLALPLCVMQALGLVSLISHQPTVTLGWTAVILGLFLAIDLTAFRQRRIEWTLPKLALGELGFWGWGILVLTAAILIGAVSYGLTHPPFGWDNQHYHLPRALKIMQTQTLTEYYPPADYTLRHLENALGFATCHAYPGNWSLYLSLLAVPHREFLFTLAQFPFSLLGGLIAYRLSRRLGADRVPALAAFAVVTTAPLTLSQSVIPYSDLFVATLLMGSLLFLLERPAGWGMVAMAGLSLGLSVGSKSTSFIYAVLIGAIALGCLLAHTWRSPRKSIGQLALFTLMTLLPSAFWFGQNWYLYGSPVLPFQLKVFGVVLFPGLDSTLFGAAQEWAYVTHRSEWWTYPWTEKFNIESGYGWLWATLLPAALLGMLKGLRAQTIPQRALVTAVSFFTLGTLVFWWKLTHHEPRYMMQVIALVGVLAAYAVSGLARPASVLVSALMTLALLGNGVLAWGYLSDRHVPGYSRNAYIGSISQTPGAIFDVLDAQPPTRVFNERRVVSPATVANYGLYGSKFQHELIDDQNLVSTDVTAFHRNLVANKVTLYFVIVPQGDAYLSAFTPEKGFEKLIATDQGGLTQALFRVRATL